MANTTISPNMNLPVPTVGEDPGPDWATNVDACLNAIDSHNHSSGQGVPVTPDGMDITTDLPFNDNNATKIKSANFQVQSAPLSGGSDLGCIYVSGKDLYYNDEDGNQVRITASGNVNAGAGSITGLPSGTASASFSGGTFTFQSATNTPATMAIGPAQIGAAVANSKTVTIAPASSLSANYALTLPSGLPGATSIFNSDSSGQMGLVPADNATFGVASSTYKVLDGGIGTTQLAAGAVTNAKLAALNYNITNMSSAVYTLSATSYTTIGGLSLQLTSIGRPVMIIFMPNYLDAGVAYVEPQSGAVQLQLAFYRDSTRITETYWSFEGDRLAPSLSFIDVGTSAATYTYSLRGLVQSGQTTNFAYCSLYVQEL